MDVANPNPMEWLLFMETKGRHRSRQTAVSGFLRLLSVATVSHRRGFKHATEELTFMFIGKVCVTLIRTDVEEACEGLVPVGVDEHCCVIGKLAVCWRVFFRLTASF